MRAPQRYILTSDHWTRVAHMRPVYELGKLWAHAGTTAALDYPTFSTHADAIRHLMERPNVPALLPRPGLSPADIMDLRLSIRSRIPDMLTATAIVPCIRYNSVQDTYEVHYNGQVLCHSPKGDVVLALLRGERFEPGFVRKALDPQYTVEEVTSDADERERSRRNRSAVEASQRARDLAAEDEARARRLRAPAAASAPPDLSIDDLLSSL